MRIVRSLVSLAILSTALAQAQSSALRGIEVADINRGADPCADFYEFAKGRWRAENPIPAAMPRWSRRWAAGEAAKDRLHEILDETSAVPNHAKGSVDQLIGDFYGACTDETQANALGVKPIAPIMAEIDSSTRSCSPPAYSSHLRSAWMRTTPSTTAPSASSSGTRSL